MLITETFKDYGLSTSFEVFPPKNNAPYKPVEDAVDKLAVYHPDFISVTYGAGGGTSVNTPKIAAHILMSSLFNLSQNRQLSLTAKTSFLSSVQPQNTAIQQISRSIKQDTLHPWHKTVSLFLI